jgi:hypothetical protein
MILDQAAHRTPAARISPRANLRLAGGHALLKRGPSSQAIMLIGSGQTKPSSPTQPWQAWDVYPCTGVLQFPVPVQRPTSDHTPLGGVVHFRIAERTFPALGCITRRDQLRDRKRLDS